jgi:hypothetical protein
MEPEKKILKYITFKTSSDFEIWQAENNFAINQVLPIPFQAKQNPENCLEQQFESKIEIEIQIFVLYWDQV